MSIATDMFPLTLPFRFANILASPGEFPWILPFRFVGATAVPSDLGRLILAAIDADTVLGLLGIAAATSLNGGDATGAIETFADGGVASGSGDLIYNGGDATGTGPEVPAITFVGGGRA